MAEKTPTLASVRSQLNALAKRHPYGYLDLSDSEHDELIEWLYDLRIVAWNIQHDKALSNEILDAATLVNDKRDSWFYGAQDWLDIARKLYNKVAAQAHEKTLPKFHDGVTTTFKNFGKDSTEVLLAPFDGASEAIQERPTQSFGAALVVAAIIYVVATASSVTPGGAIAKKIAKRR